MCFIYKLLEEVVKLYVKLNVWNPLYNSVKGVAEIGVLGVAAIGVLGVAVLDNFVLFVMHCHSPKDWIQLIVTGP